MERTATRTGCADRHSTSGGLHSRAVAQVTDYLAAAFTIAGSYNVVLLRPPVFEA